MNNPENLPAPATCSDPAHRLATDAVCSKCGSLDVELALPALFRASDGELVYVDFEAGVLWAWCPRCEDETSASFAP